MAAPFSPAPQQHAPRLPDHRNIRRFRAPSSSAESSPNVLPSAELEALKGRNQWLQYAVAGFAAWSVASTYMVVTYRGEERADLHRKIAQLKSGLFDYQSTTDDVMEAGYRATEGSRSFAEISSQLALTQVQPLFDAGAQGQALEADAIQAHPHPATVAGDSSTIGAPEAAAPIRPEIALTSSASTNPSTRFPLTFGQAPVYGLAPQYGLLGEMPDQQPRADFASVERHAETLYLANGLPSPTLDQKLVSLSVAKIGLNIDRSTQRALKRIYRSAPARRVARKTQTTVAGIHVKAYPGRGHVGAPSHTLPSASSASATPGEVAKLVLP